MRLDRAVFGCLLVGALSAGAEVTNVTASLELLGNPTTTKWPSVCIARSVMDLQVYDGKVFIGTCDWENNAGPVPLLAYDPAKNAFTNEYSSGSDSIERYHVINDGRLLHFRHRPPRSGCEQGNALPQDSERRMVVPSNPR